MNIITISGKARHGKDTAAKILKDALEERGERVLVTHYGDLVKYVCKSFFNWDGEKDKYGRGLLQYVGTDVVRHRDSMYWVNFVMDMLNFFDGEWDYVLIPDVRFPNEADVPKERCASGKCISLNIVRPDFDNGLTEEQKAHASEVSMDGYEFDYTIYNSGSVNDLGRNINEFIKEKLYV